MLIGTDRGGIGWLGALVAAVLALGAVQPSARAQTLEIVPDAGTPPADFLEHPQSVLDPQAWPNDTVRLRALLVSSEGEAMDVTEVATWTSSDPEVADFVEPGVLVGINGNAVSVWATFGALQVGPITIDYTDFGPDNGPPPGSYVPGDDPPADPLAMYIQIRLMLLQLQVMGMHVTPILNALDRTALTDHITWWNRAGRSVLPDDVNGFYSDAMLKRAKGFRILMSKVAPIIIFRHEFAVQMAAGDMFGSSGSLTTAAQLAIHELLHDVVEQSGIDIPNEPRDENGNPPEERFISGFVTIIVNKISEILHRLADGTVSDQDRQSINNLLLGIQAEWLRLRDIDPDSWDAFMCVLGWKDLDGNGIPDWLDDLLEDLGIPRLDPPVDPNPVPGPTPDPAQQIGCGTMASSP